MKRVFHIISLSIFVLIGFLVLLNISNTIALETSFLSLRANVGFFLLFCAALSSLGTILFSMSISFSKSSTSNFKKQLEDAKLNHELESGKVNQLEAKIKTLEEALKIATKK